LIVLRQLLHARANYTSARAAVVATELMIMIMWRFSRSNPKIIAK
jgi:hypothetical protein